MGCANLIEADGYRQFKITAYLQYDDGSDFKIFHFYPFSNLDNPDEFFGVSTNASEFHLSKEESGLEFIMQEESKTSNSLSLQCL